MSMFLLNGASPHRARGIRISAALCAATTVLALFPLAASATVTTWPQTTALVMTGPGINLQILAGSKSESLAVTATTFTVTVGAGDYFEVRSPGPNAADLSNDGTLFSCNFGGGNNDVHITGPKTVTFTPALAPACTASSPPAGGGGGGGGGGSSNSVVSVPGQATPDPTATGTYTPLAAMNATPDINTNLNIVKDNKPHKCTGGTLIKASGQAVYFCGDDGKRYVFPNEHIFYSWFADFSTLNTLSDSDLSQIPIGGNVVYRPGKRMVKITTDPKTYVISRHGVLRWVKTEAKAIELYGKDWNKQVDDVPDEFFFSYLIGSPIE